MMKNKIKLLGSNLVLAAVMTSILTACGGGSTGGESDSTSGSGDTTKTSNLSVTATNPADGDSNVLTNIVLNMTFDKAIDQSTLANTSFTLDGATPVIGVISYDATTNTASFTPDMPLKPSTTHTATLTTSVTDTNSNPLAAVFSANFTTEAFIQRGSVDSAGNEGNSSVGTATIKPALSADGRYMAFQSVASNLVTGDTNNLVDIFIHDFQTGETTMISTGLGGQAANGSSYAPSISADGKLVAFASDATNLDSNDFNLRKDIFVHNRETDVIKLVSVETSGIVSGDSDFPAISADGRYVAFESDANNLVTGDTNGAKDIFMRDIQNNTTIRVSVGGASGEGSYEPSISADGRYVTFTSASKLDARDTNNNFDIFVRDTQLNTTTLVSVSQANTAADGGSALSHISADGRYVVFESDATNLAPSGVTNAKMDIFVRDTQAGTTIKASRGWGGTQPDDDSRFPRISDDGRYVAYVSKATNIVLGDNNSQPDVFVYDTLNRFTPAKRVNLTAQGVETVGSFIESISISADGRYVAFPSTATNLVADDTNFDKDVFRALNAQP